MKTTLTLLIAILITCKPKSPVINLDVLPMEHRDTIIVSNDTIQIKEVVRKFIHWYETNYKMVNKVIFVDKDKKGNYKVNLEECNKFLNHLSSSGYISKVYVTEWKKYFDSKSEYFKSNPMNEGPPEGFDYDLVFMTQEPETVWKAIDSLKLEVSQIKDGKAIASTGDGEIGYDFEMGMEDGVWKIDYIATMNYD
ncbi:MAG: hypothetical protein ABI851_12915 [Saprospiraceae bacterium]